MSTIGELNNIPIRTHVLQRGREIEWKIFNFSSLSYENDDCYYSPSFHFADEIWHLTLYLRYFEQLESGGFISLYLFPEKTFSGHPINLEYTLGLKTVNGERDSEHHRRHMFDDADKGYGVHSCLLRSELHERASDLLLSDVLTVFCHLKYQKPAKFASKDYISGSSKILQDLKELYLNQKHCDVVIKIEEHVFPAHRNILAARSPVFESAFRNDMKENATGIIEIKDCDPSTFSDFLCFLYCGDPETISEKNVFSLFVTADKYNVEDLRVNCLEFMHENISVDTFCDTQILALQYSENELLQRSTDFFARNLQKIIVTEKWESFLDENPKQSNKLFMEALLTRKNSDD